jgi:CRISPR-associated endonuclease Csy4
MRGRNNVVSHYLDIHLLQEPEIPTYQLLSALYTKLHRALVRLDTSRIAVCFPDYSQSPARLGSRLRLIGPEADLLRLLALEWRSGIRDYIKVEPVAEVPDNAVQRALRRVQAKSSPERLRRRQMRRHAVTEAEALERVPDTVAEKLNLPFVQLASSSTGQAFRIYLRLGAPETNHVTGEFNAYGLSGTATIPWF